MPLLSTRDSIVCEFLAFMMCICMYSFETGALWGCVAIQKYPPWRAKREHICLESTRNDLMAHTK